MSKAGKWSPEMKRLMTGYAGPNFDKPGEIKETPLSWWSNETMPLDAFAALVNEILAAIPPETRGRATVAFRDSYGDSNGHFEITYPRRETEAEVAKRIADCERYAAASLSDERKQYERLKAKFEGA